MLRGLSAAALSLALASSGSGCGSSSEDEPLPILESEHSLRVTTRDRAEIDVLATAPLRVGKNRIVVTFPSGAGQLESASALMPAHGHGSRQPTISRDGDAFVIDDLVFFMSGRWEVRLDVRIADHDDEAIVAVDVP